MRQQKPEQSIRRTIVWFAVFAVSYIATWIIAGALLGDRIETSLTGPVIGIVLALVIVLWWRRRRDR